MKKTVAGQPSWRVASTNVEACVTELGGHLGPVTFDRRGRKISPFHVAPWATEKVAAALPPILGVLRGDLFCLPFGGNATPFRGERHPLHGETANAPWKFESLSAASGRHCLHLSLQTKTRRGRVDKRIMLIDGHNAVYSQHVISAMSGPMNLGHHAMLQFPDEPGCAFISTSRFVYGQVYPGLFENPAEGGYSALKSGAEFTALNKVPTSTGGMADLSRYPARRGFEDLVILVSETRPAFAWTAVTFPRQRYVWFALKDPRVLRETVLWISNGGRHMAPWSGRHVNVMGLEEVTSYFHKGLAESARPNPLTRQGYATCFKLNPRRPLVINYIMATLPIPAGFDKVRRITAGADGQSVILEAASGKSVRAPLDVGFLRSAK